MPQMTITTRASVLGKTIEVDQTITADSSVIVDPSLAPAKSGTLTTRTDANTGTLTMSTGHGITTGARLDVYWATGYRYGMTVGTVSTNSVPIDGGAGDDLPTANTAIVAMVPQLETLTIDDTDDVQGMAVTCRSKALAVFRDATDATILAAEVTTGSDYLWDGSGTVPLGASNDVKDVYLSHADTANTRQINVAILRN